MALAGMELAVWTRVAFLSEWHTLLIPAFRRLRQKHHKMSDDYRQNGLQNEFKVNVGYKRL